jgi:hypothetical protein
MFAGLSDRLRGMDVRDGALAAFGTVAIIAGYRWLRLTLEQVCTAALCALVRFAHRACCQRKLRAKLSKRPTLQKKKLLDILSDLVEPARTVVVRGSSSGFCCFLLAWCFRPAQLAHHCVSPGPPCFTVSGQHSNVCV